MSCSRKECGTSYCRICRVFPAHAPTQTCKSMSVMDAMSRRRDYYSTAARRGEAACPGCGELTFKQSGCPHIKCYNCSAHYCFYCREIYSGSNIYEKHFIRTKDGRYMCKNGFKTPVDYLKNTTHNGVCLYLPEKDEDEDEDEDEVVKPEPVERKESPGMERY